MADKDISQSTTNNDTPNLGTDPGGKDTSFGSIETDAPAAPPPLETTPQPTVPQPQALKSEEVVESEAPQQSPQGQVYDSASQGQEGVGQPQDKVGESLSQSTVPPPQSESDVVTAPPPKKGFPKILLILGAIVVLFLIVGVIVRVVLPMFEEEEIKTITWWGLWEEESTIQPIIEEYESENENVKIEYVKQSKKDYRERLTNALARGTGPDIFRFHNTWVPMFNNELDNVPASFMSAADYAQTFYPVSSSDMSSGTGLVGVPLGFDALTLFINEDMFEEAEVEPPKTWDDMRVVAKKLTKKENNLITQAGVALGRTENVDHWPEILGLMLIQNNANLLEPTNENAQDALVFFTLFSNVDGVWDETLPASTVAFANGKLAMYFAPSWRAFNIQEMNPNINFKTVPLPQVPKDNPEDSSVSYATYWVEGVWARSPEKEIAWDFLGYMSEKSTLEKFFRDASTFRGFGEAYPRKDMASLLTTHEVLGSIVTLAPDAQSWYLADRTFDGPTGINSQINKYFEDAINAVNDGDDAEEALLTTAQGVYQVLSQYGLVRR